MSSVLFWLLVIVVVYSLYVVRKKQKTIHALKTKQLSLNHSVRQLQNRYKELVASLPQQYELELETEHKRRLIAVGNNYFVFQAVNSLNLERLSDLVDTFSNVFSQFEDINWYPKEQLPALISRLCEALPSDTRSFNSQFYLEKAPRLFFDFSEEINELIIKNEAQSEEDTIESEEDEQSNTYQYSSETEQDMSNNS
ncbi:hypothetical protein KO525_04160 [Psychrosphaera sp. B3R10]|uniref:Uncharacterized protein n=1 Tax=Psychrosphaera algicola TaxID=3023714 RepID=A0ABT5FGR3_9GAMM|nr:MULTISPECIES: hypothetical protein [unclassified Psychrosphaera]MBU2883112.1 hypothetical protein [Psychrosphaera sp. I2R16]MBU2988568.1 hypothetical protein [Psychrosphaera sp. B3R10]MDC2890387.1 hypothetical protein [Psychrosphaera sp. G1-22]